MDKIKRYDKFLFVKKYLDGRVEIRRNSQFYKNKSFEVMDITNQYLGSINWVITKLCKMDSRRVDLITAGIQSGKRLRKGDKRDTRMAMEVASFIQNGEKIIL